MACVRGRPVFCAIAGRWVRFSRREALALGAAAPLLGGGGEAKTLLVAPPSALVYDPAPAAGSPGAGSRRSTQRWRRSLLARCSAAEGAARAEPKRCSAAHCAALYRADRGGPADPASTTRQSARAPSRPPRAPDWPRSSGGGRRSCAARPRTPSSRRGRPAITPAGAPMGFCFFQQTPPSRASRHGGVCTGARGHR